MKKFVFLSIFICLSATFCFAQKIVRIEKPDEKPTDSNSFSPEISDKEWQFINDAMRSEDWENSALIASRLIERTKAENEKKQLAQLRYFYLYSLAGKVIAFSEAKKFAEEETARNELNKAAENFIGKEIIMPPRQLLADCSRVLNYICTVKGNANALRVTATNKEGTAIHSFENVLFDQKIDLKEFIGKETFLGGTLAKVEFNESKSNLWIVRLSFVKGFVRIVVDK
ncbi:hypothetical protein BH20ACI1_BH20ACI1_24680 [soil metagenome]